MEAHHIRRSQPIDRPSLLALWERSVRATHGFLTDEDIAFYRPLVAEILAGDSLEVWVLADASKVPIGFLGLSAHSIEALFLEPAHQRRGWGRRLVAHAQQLVGGALTVDVNEENHAARSFYEAIGFAVVGASPLDGTGRPHPLLHLRREPPHDALPMLPSVRRVTAAHRTNDA
jgi:putative acetyltransferase